MLRQLWLLGYHPPSQPLRTTARTHESPPHKKACGSDPVGCKKYRYSLNTSPHTHTASLTSTRDTLPLAREMHRWAVLVATRRREIGRSSALTVPCARRGRALEAEREEGAPRASIGRRRAGDRPRTSHPAEASTAALAGEAGTPFATGVPGARNFLG